MGWAGPPSESGDENWSSSAGLFNFETDSPLDLRMKAIGLGKMLLPTALMNINPFPLARKKVGWASGIQPLTSQREKNIVSSSRTVTRDGSSFLHVFSF
jgi:hypothetical protein